MTENKVVPEKTTENKNHNKEKSNPPAKELGGREGPDPVRYGDWENKGIASDF